VCPIHKTLPGHCRWRDCRGCARKPSRTGPPRCLILTGEREPG
jgi:hypothetical protein